MAMAPNLRSFSFNLTDLQFILDQINFRPLFYKNATNGLSAVINWDGVGAVYDSLGNQLSAGGALVNGLPDAAALAAVAQWGTSYNSYTDISGLRDVTGNYNNLIPGQQFWGAVDQPFSRTVAADFKHYVDQLTSGAPVTSVSESNTSTDGAMVLNTQPVHVPGFGGNPSVDFVISYNSFDRTVTVTDITTTDNHHLTVNTNAVSSSKSVQTYFTDVTGEHTLGAPVVSPTATSSFLSGGELDPAYHPGLAAKITAAQDGGLLAMNDYNPSKNVVDYTPRMISETITTGGHVTYDANGHYLKGDGVVLMHDANGHIVYYTGQTDSALNAFKFDSTKAIDVAGLVLGSAIVDTTVPLMPGQPDGLGANGAAGHMGLNDGNVYSGAGYGELALYGQHDKQNTDANNITGHGNHEYFYGNIASIGGNAPNNGFMALFGQFFDHGLDFIGKNAKDAGGHTVTITIPLAVNDPLYGVIGQDGQPTTSITINRATVDNHWVRDAAGNVLDGHDAAHSIVLADGTTPAVDALGAAVSTAGADGIWGTADDITAIGADHKITGATLGATSPTYINHASPYIDQSQTYGSVDDVTQLLREWVIDPNTGKYVAGANLFDGHQTVAYAGAFGGTTTNTLPTLNELRAAVSSTDRTALTWEDVTQDYRHRDAHGHVGLYSNTPNPVTDPASKLPPEVAYIGADGQTYLVSNNSVVTGGALTTLMGTVHTIASTEPLLLDMNPHVDGAHLTSAAALAAIATLNASIAGMGGTFANVGGVITLTIPPGPGGGTYTGVSALAPWVNFADFSIQKTFFGAPGPSLTDAQHAAIGEILMDSVGDHYIAGDGRANENFGLTAIHQAFHEEHGFQVVNIENAIRDQDTIASNRDATNNHGGGDGSITDPNHKILHDWQTAVTQTGAATGANISIVSGHYENTITHDYTDKAGNISWDQEKLFNGAKLTVEMEYQHSVVDQYARAVSPDIQEFAGVTTAKNAAISLEYSQAAFRFGHSTLRDTIDTMDPNGGVTGKIMSFALEKAFLNPAGFATVGAGAVIQGEARQLMNEVDQFVTPAMNEGLLAQPLDLAAINIARGRDVGLPTLNAFKAASGVGTIYNSWNDFKTNMIHPERLVDFVAAYSFDGNMDKAQTIMDLNAGVALNATETAIVAAAAGVGQIWNYDFAHRFLTGDKTADTADGVNHIDLWVGGLSEVHVAGGILGETFNAIFVNQIENLMDGDRLYYLQRLVNQGFGNEMQNEQLKDIFERTTGARNLNGNIFTYADAYYDEGRNARLATEDLKDATKLTNLYDANKAMVLAVDGTGHNYTTTVLPTHVPLFDLWGNAVVDLFTKSGVVLTKAFDAATLTWTASSTFNEPANPGPLYFADGTYVGAPQNKYGSLIAAHSGDIAVTAAVDVTDPNLGVPVTDNGLGTVVGDVVHTGIGIYTGDDVTQMANGTVGAHTITLKYGDEATAHDAHTIKFTENYIYDARPTGTTTNLDGSIDTGTNAAEILVGTAYDDYIQMGIGDDTAYGGAGNDYITGGMANAGHNTIYGGDGNDFLVGGDAPDLIDGGNGDDWIFGQSSGSSVNGIDQLIGGAGNDHIFGGIGIDKMFGGTGDDYIYGGSDTDPIVFGGDGNDYMNGGSGVDVMNGDNGDDIMDGGPGVDQLFGGNGDDILRPGDISDVAGNGGGGDVLIGGDAATNNAGVSTDTGFDFADYSQTTTSVGLVGDLANQAAVGSLPADKTPLPPGVPRATNIGDVWFEMEGIIGTKNNDHLMGDSAVDPSALVSKGSNWLIGGSGNDLIEGRGGNDVIIGGSIRLDTLNGTYARTDGLGHVVAGDAYHAANDYSVNAEGASHRIYDDAMLQNNGLLDAASGGGITYAKHLTTLEQSRAYKDYVLGDNASLANASAGPVTDTTGGNDTVVYGGNRSDYSVTIGSFASAHQGTIAYEKIQDNRAVTATGILVSDATGLISGDGTDLVAGVNEFQFADQTIAAGNLNAQLNIVQTAPGQATGTNPVNFGGFTAALVNDNDVVTTSIQWEQITNVGGFGGGQTLTPVGAATTNGAFTIDPATIGNQVERYEAVATIVDHQNVTSTFTSGELIIGTNGNNNNLNGTDGNDIIFGLGGSDTLRGGAGNDMLYGGAGTDTLIGGLGNDTMDGGQGSDTYRYTIGDGADTISDTGTGTGTANRDVLEISGANGAVNETLNLVWNGTAVTGFEGGTVAGVERITADLGGGSDTLSYAASTSGVTVNLGTGVASGLFSIANIENVTGTTFADTLTGGAGNNTLLGGAGNDTLIYNVTTSGGNANTNLTSGRDIIDGGTTALDANNRDTGSDTYVLNGTTATETFKIMTRAVALANGVTGLAADTEIVVTRQAGSGITNPANNFSNMVVLSELTRIEEIKINTLALTSGNPVVPGNFSSGGDAIQVLGNFGTIASPTTSLNFSTITVNGGPTDTVDISGLTSDHRIVFNGAVNSNQVIGTLRPQDVVNYGVTVLPDHAGTSPDTSGSTGGSTGSGDNSGATGGTDTSGGTSGGDGTTHVDASGSDDGDNDTDTTTPPPVVPPVAPVLDHAVTINGADGANVQTAGDQNNTIIGHSGDDLISVGNGNNMLDGGAGNDTIVAGNGNNNIFGGDGNDHIFVGNGNNTIDAGNGDDTVHVGTGTNVFVAHANDGADNYYGNAGGNDTLDMSAIMTNVEANLGSGGGSGFAKTGGVIDTIHNVQNITTGTGDDTITASDAHNTIDVGDHSATGHDTVIFRTAASADGDNILNFQAGDKIDVHGMMGGTINLLPNGTATLNHDIAVHFDATTHGDSIVTGIDDGGNHFSFDVKGHHLIGTDFAA